MDINRIRAIIPRKSRYLSGDRILVLLRYDTIGRNLHGRRKIQGGT